MTRDDQVYDAPPNLHKRPHHSSSVQLGGRTIPEGGICLGAVRRRLNATDFTQWSKQQSNVDAELTHSSSEETANLTGQMDSSRSPIVDTGIASWQNTRVCDEDSMVWEESSQTGLGIEAVGPDICLGVVSTREPVIRGKISHLQG
jgi:hypothetical protein